MRKLGLLTWLAFLALRPILKASRPWRRGSVWAPRRTAKNLGPPEPNCTRGQSKSSNLSRWRNELINLNFDIFWFWPRMPNGGPFRAGEGKRKNTVTNIYTQYMKKWRQHHRWKKNKDIAILKPDTGGLGSIKLVAKLMPAAEICIGIYHWKNDHPGRPLGFHSNIRFTQHYIFNLCQCVFFKFVLCHSCCLECTQCGWI